MTWNELLKELEPFVGTAYMDQAIYVYDNEGAEIKVNTLILTPSEGEDPEVPLRHFLTLNKHPII